MKLRYLMAQDASLMLEWMHDESVVEHMKADFANKTINDCLEFIKSSENSSESLHMAIVDDDDMYMGTVSLKHIKDNSAELGITLRRCAMNKNYSKYAVESIFEYGHKKYGIDFVYWCVDPENKRAIRFYDKNGYDRCNVPDNAKGYSSEEKEKYVWYSCSIRSF